MPAKKPDKQWKKQMISMREDDVRTDKFFEQDKKIKIRGLDDDCKEKYR